MTRLYLAGPMSGLEDHNFPAFNKAADELRAAGYEVENPATFGVQEGWAWVDYMKRDIPLMLKCDGVALLDDWYTSRGACLERNLALELAFIVKPVAYWLAGAKAVA